MRAWGPAAAALAAALAAGCGGDEPKRFQLSGEVKYDGRPIPYGEVLFTPDGSKKNAGPQGIAAIRDGRYDTAAGDGKGVAGGPTVVRVTGFTAPGGKLLCEVELPADLPRQDATHDIDVPKQQAAPKNRPQPTEI
jgi:hypothetical protein